MTIVVAVKAAVRTEVPLRTAEGGQGLRPEELTRALTPADLAALHTALHLSEQGSAAPVVTLTVAPPTWEGVLRTTLALGAQRAIRVWAPNWPASLAEGLDGSGVTTRFLARCAAEAIAPLAPQLVLTGEKSGDTGHECFGATLAVALGWPFAHRALTVEPTGNGWGVSVKLDRGYRQQMELSSPALVTITGSPPAKAPPSLPAWMNSLTAEIAQVSVGQSPPPLLPTTFRPPVPRVKGYALPDPELDSEQRIRALVSLPASGGGVTLGAELGLDAQVDEVVKLLQKRGYAQ